MSGMTMSDQTHPMQPLRITLATVGTRGDVQPVIALARRLRARGHTVRIAAPPDFAGWAASEGLAFAPVGSDMRRYLADHPGLLSGNARAAMRAGRDYFKGEFPLHLRDIAAACEGADAVVWAGLAVAAVPVAQTLRLPWLGLFFTSCALASAQHPPPPVRHRALPRWVNRLLWALHDWVAHRLAGRLINRELARQGQAPVDLAAALQSGPLFVAADPVLFPRAPEWKPHIRQGNFIFLDDPRPLDPDLQAWLDQGEPPIYVGFGSMAGHGTARIDQLLVDALAGSGRRVLVGGGWAGLGARGLPAHWRTVGDVPHQALFPRMAAVVHHGGSGTTANALRAGVPQLVVPLILDQYHHAHRLWLAGLMPRPVPMESISAQQLAAAIDATLALPPGPRMEAAQRLRASDACAEIVQAVESLAAR